MQQIIVYRNPIEAAFWNGLYGAELVPIFAGIVVFIVLFIGMNKLATDVLHLQRNYANRTRDKVLLYAEMALAAAAAVYVVWSMWL